MKKTLKIEEDVHARLTRAKRGGMSFSEVIDSLLEMRKAVKKDCPELMKKLEGLR